MVRVKDRVLIVSFRYLSITDINSAALTCKTWLGAALDSELWQVLVSRDYSITVHLDDWKKEYFRLRRDSQLIVRTGIKQLHLYYIPEAKLTSRSRPEIDRSSRLVSLDNGQIMITGGDRYSMSAWLFDPQSDELKSLPDMLEPRRSHSLVQFEGQVLAIGGYNGRLYLDTVETWDGQVWTLHSQLQEQRFRHTSIVTKAVYVLYGYNRIDQLNSVEQYRDSTWITLPYRLTERMYGVGLIHFADDTILLIGGREYHNFKRGISKLCLKTGHIEKVGDLQVQDHFYTTGVNLRKEFLITGAKGLHRISKDFECTYTRLPKGGVSEP
jgi:hypothetical protein